MKKVLVILISLVVLQSCNTNGKDKKGDETATSLKDRRKPGNDIEISIYRCADSMMEAFKNKDWKTFAKYNHPEMIRRIGGLEMFEGLVIKQMKQVPDSAFKRMEAGKILQVVTTDKDIQCVLEQLTEMHLDQSKITSTIYLIGESIDKGKSWTFFDGSNEGVLKTLDIKPNVSPALTIPAKKQQIVQL